MRKRFVDLVSRKFREEFRVGEVLFRMRKTILGFLFDARQIFLGERNNFRKVSGRNKERRLWKKLL